ncbi:tyrosine-type recombinase/integrase [Methylorubrum extorquens]|uniref:tyrosine-type recombinase/integrase n=1 Tax=Methylorubrum extorquens TaxID=408 RepID=UPI0035A22F9F
MAERRKAQDVVPTFAEAVERVHGEHKASWANAEHAQQWRNTLKQYAYPQLGARRVDQIDTPDVLRVLPPIWLTKPETARRVRQRVGTVLDWAKAAGYRSGENPIEGVAKGLPKQSDRDQHHAALPYAQVPSFIVQLRAAEASEGSRLAFEFLILTAARAGEVLGARWDEMSVTDQLWTVPATRMKAKREQRVALNERCLAILSRAHELAAGSALVFPGRSGEKPLSNMVFLMLLRRMELPITAYGFRFSFRDWAVERTSLPREVAEMALAHAVENRVEAAYARSDLLERRRNRMERWADFVCPSNAQGGAPMAPCYLPQRFGPTWQIVSVESNGDVTVSTLVKGPFRYDVVAAKDRFHEHAWRDFDFVQICSIISHQDPSFDGHKYVLAAAIC